ncbi:uncharacterized protein ARMOST_09602 [Armillaria ostoyae]|uniref:SWIM-type domain-containing protein n=1 Tax=Armillaria ostoyae TaxID=47428 RepID=A0A284RBX8_ARMOS|nr:uncharacterized protein ARMOST_09602 [Armillaria ostoyae]
MSMITYEISDRMGRAKDTKVEQRTQLPDGTGDAFVMLGSHGMKWKVTVNHTPSCTCPDYYSGRPCKHLIHVFLYTLKVLQTDPVWLNRHLSATDLQRLLGRPVTAVSIPPATPTPSLKRPGAVVPGSHVGERPTKRARMDTSALLEGLSQEEKDDLLGQAAARDPEVAKMIAEAKKAHAEKVLVFSREVGRADNVLHSLDDLRPRHRYDHSHEVSEGIDKIIEKILFHINDDASHGTCKNAASAIISIASETLSLGGEIGKCVLQGPLPYCDALERIFEHLDIADCGDLIEDIQGLGESFDEYGMDEFSQLAERLKEEHDDALSG